MHSQVSESLLRMGFTGEIARRCENASPASGLVPARIVRQERGAFLVQTAAGIVAVQPAGRLLHAASGAVDLPVVGDWVLVTPTAPAVVQTVAERTTLLARRAAGGTSDVQPIAANVDVAIVVQPLDQELNLRRIERTLVLARGAGITPVVVLTKADLAIDRALAEREAIAIAGDARVVTVGLHDPVEQLLGAELAPGRTAVLIGPSGAGKSTLANRLLGEARLAVGGVRAGDAKGRHTTTHRELVVLASGALLVDGPGMRELGLWADGGESETFDEIARLAASCRFRDCQHRTEPGCSVREAVDGERLTSFHKLARESVYEASRTDAGLQAERRRSARLLSRAARDVDRRKRG